MINLEGKKFSPLKNSEGGRVASDAVFIFTQTDDAFTATYSGEGFSDGHLIGKMIGDMEASLIYHCRAKDGSLEAGEANASFKTNADNTLTISMNWRWMNGTQQTGTSLYGEIT